MCPVHKVCDKSSQNLEGKKIKEILRPGKLETDNKINLTFRWTIFSCLGSTITGIFSCKSKINI